MESIFPSECPHPEKTGLRLRISAAFWQMHWITRWKPASGESMQGRRRDGSGYAPGHTQITGCCCGSGENPLLQTAAFQTAAGIRGGTAEYPVGGGSVRGRHGSGERDRIFAQYHASRGIPMIPVYRGQSGLLFYSIGNFSEFSYRTKTLRGMRSYARGTKAALLKM